MQCAEFYKEGMNSSSIMLQEVAEKDPRTAEVLKALSCFYQVDKKLSCLVIT